ncbi:hypothetical protein K493DRAFT_305618 [Basidiobolus meristosporus CBS 931.73]|uniref:Uncharacterized protein n=1 Tax=Basidiobolus meristosporus CBS 931.73 TaxID=1314790 RepID=A0A1Y1XV28_9FUNG|nr:hypothetical protein K493DRAFT_305618 [Basidiobolus meristosporus CBS 931.73]|eukprot:ORX89609.1 hypothetical protein K493DRAFT_305618 [Basidiobolus meristosporus CBS 931.73]
MHLPEAKVLTQCVPHFGQGKVKECDHPHHLQGGSFPRTQPALHKLAFTHGPNSCVTSDFYRFGSLRYCVGGQDDCSILSWWGVTELRDLERQLVGVEVPPGQRCLSIYGATSIAYEADYQPYLATFEPANFHIKPHSKWVSVIGTHLWDGPSLTSTTGTEILWLHTERC